MHLFAQVHLFEWRKGPGFDSSQGIYELLFSDQISQVKIETVAMMQYLMTRRSTLYKKWVINLCYRVLVRGLNNDLLMKKWTALEIMLPLQKNLLDRVFRNLAECATRCIFELHLGNVWTTDNLTQFIETAWRRLAMIQTLRTQNSKVVNKHGPGLSEQIKDFWT